MAKEYCVSLHLDTCQILLFEDADCEFVFKQGKHYQSDYFHLSTARLTVLKHDYPQNLELNHQFT